MERLSGKMALFCCIAALWVILPAGVSYQNVGELDESAVFSFAIMSDNKGDSPSSKIEFARMVDWINESGDAFVIGLGDHVKKDWQNDFLSFLQENAWWHRCFYPNVADGENEYYGSGQGDWGAGRPMLDEVDMASRPEVVIRDNKAEYYATIVVEGYTVHLIQLTFSDTPSDTWIAFTEDSRRYLVETLTGIEKGEKDIVVVCAHSRTGSWIELLSEERRRLVMEKADLVLSATTHFYTRIVPTGYLYVGALCLNTGSITHPSGGSDPGYLQVHVLEDPFRLVVQYHDAGQERRSLQCRRYSHVKEMRGITIQDACSYVPGLPTCWPEDARTLPLEVVQGDKFTVLVRAVMNDRQVHPTVTVDLTEVGGDFLIMFDDGTHGDSTADDNTYSLEIPMPSYAPLGTQVLAISMEEGGATTNATLLVKVKPRQDYQIYADEMHPDWIAEKAGKAEMSLVSTMNPYNGLMCQNLSMDRGGGIRYRFKPTSGFPTSGFTAISFQIRPVVFPVDSVYIQGSGSSGSSTVSFQELGVSLATEKWNSVQVPLEAIRLNETMLSYLRIYSLDPASFYLDDLRISSAIPETWIHLVVAILLEASVISLCVKSIKSPYINRQTR